MFNEIQVDVSICAFDVINPGCSRNNPAQG